MEINMLDKALARKPLARPQAFLLLLLFNWAVLILGGCDGVAMTDAEYVERAKQYQDDNDIPASIIELKNAILQNPANAEARWLLGKSYVLVGDGASAEKELHHARKLDMADEAIVVPLARAYYLQGKFEPLLEETVVQDNFSPETKAAVYVVRGETYLALKDIDQAAEEMQQALEVAPDSISTWNGNARLALARKDMDSANQWLNRLLETAPDTAETQSLAGEIALETDDYEAAESAFTTTLEIQPGNIPARLGLAIAFLDQDKPDEAIPHLDHILAKYAGHPLVNYYRATAAFMKKDFETAKLHADRSLEVDPDYLPSHLISGASAYFLGQFEIARNHLQTLVNQAPRYEPGRKLLAATELYLGATKEAADNLALLVPATDQDARLFSLVGTAALRSGDLEASRQLLEKSLSIDSSPDEAINLARLGASRLRSGDRAQGLADLQRAWELDPNLTVAGAMIALSHLQAKDYAEALATAKKLQTNQPDKPQGYTLAGIAYGGLGDVAQSRKAFEKALEVSPGDPDASGNLAALALNEGNSDKARSFYEDALEQNPGHLKTLLKLAELEAGNSNKERSTALLTQAIEANPQAPEPRIVMARLQIIDSQPLAALKTIEPLQEQYRDSAEILELAGRAQLMTGDYNAAVRNLRRWADIQPDAPLAHFYLANALERQGHPDQALDELETVLRLDPRHTPSRFAQARILTKTKQLTQAGELLDELQAAHPDNPSIAELQGRIALAQGNPREAITHFETTRRHRENNHVIIQLATAQWQAGDTAAGDNTLRAWISNHPEDLLTRLVLADALFTRGESRAAQAMYTEILSLAPENAHAHNNLAWLILQENRPKDALAHAQSANRYQAGNPVYMDTLALVLLETGQTPEALRLLQNASKRAPDNLDIQFHLAKALAQDGQTSQAKAILTRILSETQPFAERDAARSLQEKLPD